MTAATPSLTDFLLARIAEDEAVAERAAAFDYDDPDDAPWRQALHSAALSTSSAHIARHDPARVLAECEAKRSIVTLASAYSDGPEAPRTLNLANDVLAIMATTWANHPDYNEAWRP